MATLLEFDAWLESDAAGIKEYTDAAALAMRVMEWLGTPEGSHVDLPGWGHTLQSFRFEPTNSDTEVRMEIAIVNKLRIDIPSVRLQGIRVAYPEIDRMDVTLDIGVTVLTETVSLS